MTSLGAVNGIVQVQRGVRQDPSLVAGRPLLVIHREPREWETLATDEEFPSENAAMIWVFNEMDRVDRLARSIWTAVLISALFLFVMVYGWGSM